MKEGEVPARRDRRPFWRSYKGPRDQQVPFPLDGGRIRPFRGHDAAQSGPRRGVHCQSASSFGGSPSPPPSPAVSTGIVVIPAPSRAVATGSDPPKPTRRPESLLAGFTHCIPAFRRPWRRENPLFMRPNDASFIIHELWLSSGKSGLKEAVTGIQECRKIGAPDCPAAGSGSRGFQSHGSPVSRSERAKCRARSALARKVHLPQRHRGHRAYNAIYNRELPGGVRGNRSKHSVSSGIQKDRHKPLSLQNLCGLWPLWLCGEISGLGPKSGLSSEVPTGRRRIRFARKGFRWGGWLQACGCGSLAPYPATPTGRAAGGRARGSIFTAQTLNSGILAIGSRAAMVSRLAGASR